MNLSISFEAGARGKMPESARKTWWLSEGMNTLDFEAFLEADDFLLVFCLEFLHEVVILLNQSM